ncbi:hypothetical protein KFE98_17770 [bacterium SCSIO 12741]|nr:hypothetical protein KFE98_17770 [bacterium SCSIO 12741]
MIIVESARQYFNGLLVSLSKKGYHPMILSAYRALIGRLNRIPTKVTSLIYLVLILFMIWANFWDQHFCIPVSWASWVLLVVTIAFLLFPFMEHIPWFRRIGLLLHGCFIWILIYSLGFAASFDGIAPFVLITLGILVWGIGLIPYMWMLFIHVCQLRYKKYKHLRSERFFFWLGMGIPPALALFFVLLLGSVQSDLQYARTTKDFQELHRFYPPPKKYAMERLLGAHFIYHTQLCLYDGWRPPLHDPWLNTYLFLSNSRWQELPDTLNGQSLTLMLRAQLYHEVFPDSDMAIDCDCSRTRLLNKETFIKKAMDP